MKKILSTVMLAFFVLGIIGCSTQNSEDKTDGLCAGDFKSNCDYEAADMSSYETMMDKQTKYVSAAAADVTKVMEEKKSAVLYFGYPGCPWCEEAVPILNDAASEKDTDIMYVATRDSDKNSLITQEESDKLISYFGDEMKADDEGNKHLYVPFVVVVKDGSMVAAHLGTVDGHDAHERHMTEDEIKQLRNIYDSMLKKL